MIYVHPGFLLVLAIYGFLMSFFAFSEHRARKKYQKWFYELNKLAKDFEDQIMDEAIASLVHDNKTPQDIPKDILGILIKHGKVVKQADNTYKFKEVK